MSSSDPSAEREQLEKAIAAQESLRGAVDDAIIDATIATLKEKLAALAAAPTEQRKLATVLFMDIVGHTALVRDLDPEEQMALVDPLLARFAARVEEFGGHVARYQGDGFKAIFGLPVAKENDPQQAIRAGLAIQDEAGRIATELKEARDFPDLRVRVGISTGLVFAGGATEGEDTIKGACVNLAARLESLAEPGTVLVSHDTYQLVGGLFDFEPLEAVPVKGFADPVASYRVLRAKQRGFYRGTRGVEGVETRMIGREAELIQLQKALSDVAEERDRQLITIVGEAGIGKSRLIYEFENWVDLQPENFLLYKGRARLETQGQPYGLLRDLFASHFEILDDDPAQVAREKLLQGIASDLGSGQKSGEQGHALGQLLGYDFSDSPHLQAVLDNPRKLRDEALKALDNLFRTVSDRSPTLILFEDLHWADNASLDAVNQLVLEWSDMPILILSTTRPGLFERRPNWGEGQDFHRRIQLVPLSKRESRRLVDEVLQKVSAIPDDIRELVVGSAEGNPFYVEELIKLLIDDGVIVPGEREWRVQSAQLADVHVPATLTGVLQARLDGLPAEERSALQGASVIGRVFWDRALEYIQSSLADGGREREITAVLDSLRARELVFRRETSAFAEAREHIFKHALLREVTYESVLKRVRQTYHALVAEWIIEHAGDRESEFAALIADHLVLAGRGVDAVEYLRKAGEEAAGKYANEEAIRFFNWALKLLPSQPETPARAEIELDILIKLGPVLIAARGFNSHSYERNYNRAAELATETGSAAQLFVATWNQQKYWQVAGDYERARLLNSRLFHIAEQAGDDSLLLEAYHSEWTMETSFGNARAALECTNKGLEIYSPEMHHGSTRVHGHDAGVCALGSRAFNLWVLGYPDQAKQSALHGLALSDRLAHPFSSCVGRWGIIWTLYFRGEFAEVEARAQEWLAFSRKNGLSYFDSHALLLWGGALVKQGKADEGMVKILAARDLKENKYDDPFDTKTLVEYLSACLASGTVGEGLSAVARWKELIPITGHNGMEQEICRLSGELMLADDSNRTEIAEAEFQLAIEISRKQHAKSLELRAVMSLVRLWQKQGKALQAHERLSEIYNWFTEGFDTADLLEAKGLLDELAK